jgi:hypothetical protein
VFSAEGDAAGWCDYPTASDYITARATTKSDGFSELSFTRELVYNMSSESYITDMRNVRGLKVARKARDDGFDMRLAGTHIYVAPSSNFGVTTFFNAGPGCEIFSHYFLHDIGLNATSEGNSVFVASALNGRADILQRTIGDGLAISPDGTRVFVFGAVTVGVNQTYLGTAPGGNVTDEHVVATFNRSSDGELTLLDLTLVLNSGDFIGLEALSNTELLSYSATDKKFVVIAVADGSVSDRFTIPSSDKVVAVTDFTTDRFDNIWVAAQWSASSALSSSLLAVVVAAVLVVLNL